MKKKLTYLLRAVFVIFVAAIAFSPLFTNLAELEGLGLTPQGYLPVAFNADNSTPMPTNTPPATNTPGATPTNTVPPVPDLKINFILYNPPGNDPPGEYIELKNFGTAPQNIMGWIVTNIDGFDAGGNEKVLHNFTFPSYEVPPGGIVRLWTRVGINAPPNFYWNQQNEVWQNDGDIATLFNEFVQVVDICTYSGGGMDTSC
jgi:hypothetical protein